MSDKSEFTWRCPLCEEFNTAIISEADLETQRCFSCFEEFCINFEVSVEINKIITYEESQKQFETKRSQNEESG